MIPRTFFSLFKFLVFDRQVALDDSSLNVFRRLDAATVTAIISKLGDLVFRVLNEWGFIIVGSRLVAVFAE
jgi:hypothetical protein